MAKKNTPIGGVVGNNQTMNAINAMSDPATGVTAGDVIKQPRQVSSNFEFQARGGIQNTINQKIQGFQKQMAYREQQKQFEKFLAGKEQSAMALYQEAVTNDPGIKQWVPHPDLFYDDATGAFMPLKYTEAFRTGFFKYQEDKQKRQDSELQGKKLDQSIGYQNESLRQREQGLGLQERGVKATEANTLVSAANSAEAARKNQVKEDTDAAKFAESNARKDRDAVLDATKAYTTASNSYDDEAKKMASNAYKKSKQAARDSQFKLMKHNSIKSGQEVSDEAINIAMDIQEASDIFQEYEAALNGQPFDIKKPPMGMDPTQFARGLGNEFDIKHGYSIYPGMPVEGSALADRIAQYGKKIMAKSPEGKDITTQDIDGWLNKYSPEKVIQTLLILSKQKKSIGK